MERSLVILAATPQTILADDDGSLLRFTLPSGEAAGPALLRLWREEVPAATSARLVLAFDGPLGDAAANGLADAARREKRRIEGAWPLAALLRAPPGRASLQVAAIGDRALVRFRSASGEDTLRGFSGSRFADAAQAEIHEALARSEDGVALPATLAADGGPVAALLRGALAGTELTEVALADFLDRARALDPGAEGDVIDRTGPRLLWGARRRLAVGALFLAGLAALAGTWAHRRHLAAQAQAARTLWEETEAEQRRQLDLERRKADHLVSPRPLAADFLAALAAATPSSVVLESLRIDQGSFAVRGRILADAPDRADAAAGFRRGLVSAAGLWQLDASSYAPLRGATADGSSADEIEVTGEFATEPVPHRRVAGPAGTLLEQWAPGWRIEARPDPTGSGPQHYALTPASLGATAWSGLLGLTRRVCAAPGMAIEQLDVAASPRSDGSFTRMELVLTVR